jgi:hypothetical protein
VSNDINSKDTTFSRLEPGLAPTILFKVLKVESGVVRVFLESTINGVAGIADRDVPNQAVEEVIHSRCAPQREHGVEGFASREEENTGQTTHYDYGYSKRSIEVFLDIEIVMSTC